jgi:IMP dehydrogenase
VRPSKIIGEALTYDDVLLVPNHSSVLPRDVDVRTRLTRHITMHIPLLSAAMDTVTESAMAIAMAREGWIGILHKNMTIAAHAEEVDLVKRSESGMILHPVTVNATQIVGDVIQLMTKYRISGIPVVDDQQRLIGIITNRDLRFEPDEDQQVSEIMTRDHLSPPQARAWKRPSSCYEIQIEKPPWWIQGVLQGLSPIKIS